MIFCNLKGGLGNMLFQIAATISLSKDLKTEASFPNLNSQLVYLNNRKTETPDLNHAQEYLSFLPNLKTQNPDKKLPIFRFPFHYVERELPVDCWVDGFFQSEKYFAHNRDEILNVFTQTEEIINIFDKYSIGKEEVISMHVRRGDYLKLSSHHPPLLEKYYREALSNFPVTTKVFVFSDDIEWCKQTFTEDRFCFIKEKDYLELFLMSKCDYHIVANSSFSWWGAWLSSQKKVIAPKKHFGIALNNIIDTDIYPSTWIRL